jgi:hypothetical protein
MAVRLEAPLAVGFVEDPLVAAFGAPLGLAAAGGILDSALVFFTGHSPFRASPPSGLAGCSVFASFVFPPEFFCFMLACKPCRDLGLNFKQESGSNQLGVPTWGRFHLKPRHCPLTLSPTRRPPETSLLYQNESSPGAWQHCGSVFVRA